MNYNEKRHGILSAGNWIIDHVKIVDTFPTQDALATILSQSQGTGGVPYNVLIDLAKLGATFPLSGIGLIGEDADGDTILADCERFGIDGSRVHRTPDAATSFTDVMTVQSTGRRTFFHMRGANALLSESHFDLGSSTARIFNYGYLLLLDAMDELDAGGRTGASRILERARALGFKTAVDIVSEDSDRFVKVVTPSLPHVDYLIINEFEAARSTGIEVEEGGKVSTAGVEMAARALFEMGVHEWVVIHFPEGALAMNRDGHVALQGSVRVPAEEIAGTAGAGDAFAAGVLYGLHEGLEIQECLRIAVCTAASNLSDATCTGGVTSLEECLELGRQHGFSDFAAVNRGESES